MDNYLHMPQGHLLNITPRKRHGKRSDLGVEGAQNTQPEHTLNHGGSPANSGSCDTETGAQAILRRIGPATKLPLPRDIMVKGREQSKEPATSKHKDHDSRYRSPDETMDKGHEQYWKKVRGKFEKESPSGKTKDKHKEPYYGAYRKILWLASSPKSEAVKRKLMYAGGATRDSPKTRVASPTSQPRLRPGCTSPSKSDMNSPGQRKRQLNGIHRTNSDTDESILYLPSGKIDNATDSSINSQSSSSTEWEDRFVVNMPSAKEPNPPTMSAEQIIEFQQSIKKVHEDGVMLDPDSLPPADKASSDRPKPTSFDGQDPPRIGADGHPSSSHLSLPRYYSADEVGRNRISTIWEEPPSTKPKEDTPNAIRDGSFLGCKEISGPNDKNPDEILLFSPTEGPRVIDILSPVSTTPEDKTNYVPRQRNPDLKEKTVAREGRKPVSPNMKPVQCPKSSPRTMCRQASCHQVDKAAQGLAKENSESRRSSRRFKEQKPTCRDDDVFIITPTITRTMVSMTDIRGHAQKSPSASTPTCRTVGEIITDTRARPQGKPSPLRLRRATQNSQEQSNASSAAPLRSVPVRIILAKHRGEAGRRRVQQSPDMRGYIRMPGMVQSPTQGRAEHTGSNPQQSRAPGTKSSIESSPSDSPPTVRSSPAPNISPVGSIDRGQQGGTNIVQQPAEVEVAELDGLQVQEHKETTQHITDLDTDLPKEMASPTKGATNAPTLTLIMEIFIISAAQVEALWQWVVSNQHSNTELLKLTLNGIIRMLGHCLQVLRTWLTAFSTYNITGAWPRPAEQDLAQSVTDICQAVAYLVVLCFMMTIVERAAGYIVFVGSWIVWFARPFGWFFVAIGRALWT